MIKIIFNIILSGLFVFSAFSANAMQLSVTIANSDLPLAMQSCVSSGDCSVNTSSVADYDNTLMFDYYDNISGTSGKLVRYSLTDSYQVDFDIVSFYSGYIWLQAADNYSASESTHDFSLYLDQITPFPTDLTYGATDPTIINLSLTTTDLLAGTGFTSTVVDSSLPGGFSESGSLITDGMLEPCLDDICGTDALLNLIFLQYSTNGSLLSLTPSLNSADSRETLYSQKTFYDIGEIFFADYHEQVFVVQAVPVPASIWLFVSGLIGFSRILKYKKS